MEDRYAEYSICACKGFRSKLERGVRFVMLSHYIALIS